MERIVVPGPPVQVSYRLTALPAPTSPPVLDAVRAFGRTGSSRADGPLLALEPGARLVMVG